MTFTRAQAESLLNKAEMGLYDDSRANAMRSLPAENVEKRIDRARKARDRARDLLQRQKLASRAKTGNKRGTGGDANQRSKHKAELLADILKRFEGQLKPARTREKDAAAAGKRSKPANKARAAKASARKAAKKTTKKAVKKTQKATVKKAAKKPAASEPNQAARGRKTASKTANASKPISPNRALGNTRKLLEAKHKRERKGQPWQTLDPEHDHLPQAGYQSAQAAENAEDLHAGESRIQSIQGSISTRGRRNQGRRDHRG